MVVTSGILSPDTMREELAFLPTMLSELSIAETNVWFGFGCRAHADKLYHTALVSTNDLSSWVQSEGSAVGFDIGRSDLFVELPNNALCVHFCHDSDIHVDGCELVFVSAFERRWRQLGYDGYVRQNGVWVPFSACAA